MHELKSVSTIVLQHKIYVLRGKAACLSSSHRRTRVERPSKWWLVRNYSCEPSTVSTLHSTSLFVRPGSCAGRRSLAGRGPHGRGVVVPCGIKRQERGRIVVAGSPVHSWACPRSGSRHVKLALALAANNSPQRPGGPVLALRTCIRHLPLGYETARTRRNEGNLIHPGDAT